jgi:hypothetical protein
MARSSSLLGWILVPIGLPVVATVGIQKTTVCGGTNRL